MDNQLLTTDYYSMTSILRIITATTVMIAAGIVSAKWTNRFGPTPELVALSARFESVPIVLGDWKAEAFQLPARERKMAGAAACLARRYRNPRLKASVTVLLLGGLPGDIATHTPDVCYPGAGFTMGSSTSFPRDYGPPQRHAEFQTVLATRTGPNASVLRIYWGWNAGKGWSAPDDPRWRFVAEPVLSKLYVVRETAGQIVDPRNDVANDFMALLLPALDRSAFGEG
jgi:hypothetical protein